MADDVIDTQAPAAEAAPQEERRGRGGRGPGGQGGGEVGHGGLREVDAGGESRLGAGDSDDEGPAGPRGERTGTEDQLGHVSGTFRAGKRWMYHAQAIPYGETVASGA